MGEDDFDFGNGGFDDNIDFGNLDLGNLDLGNLDLGNINFEDLNLGDLSNLDLSGTGLSEEDMALLIGQANQDMTGTGDLQGGGLNLDDLFSNGGGEAETFPVNGGGSAEDLLANLGKDEETNGPLLTPEGVDESFANSLSDDEYRRYLASLDSDYKSPLSDVAPQKTSGLYQDDYNKQWEQNPDKLTSQWQKMSDGRYAMVQDDGSAIGFDEDGNSFALSQSQVNDRIKSGDLNTFNSGYNTATGGNKIAPGGGKMTTAADGTQTWKMPNGNTVTQKPDGTSTTTTPGGKTTTTSPSGQQTTANSQNDWMKYLMMLLALDAMRNKGGDSGPAIMKGSDRTQTPYAAIQQAAGYRPGQGGIQYFSSAVNRAAGGGIGSLSNVGSVDAAGGRLLRGPGDGVSDSINAQIGDNQPARLADGEYVLDARTVAEIGNGSTGAGARKLAAMVSRIEQSRRHAKRGKPSNADQHLLA